MGGELLELADRCEAATGPDRELDALIHIPECREGERLHIIGGNVSWFVDGRERAWGGHIPHYTASLDAAMTLVPEGALWSVDYKVNIGEYFRTPEGEPERAFRGGVGVGPVPMQWYYSKRFASPALALCAAALRARSQTSD